VEDVAQAGAGAKGGHGFGMQRQNLPTDHWIERFTDWLEMQGWMK